MILLLNLFLTTVTAFAQLEFKWIGVSTFSLSDGKTTLLFDPAITRIPIPDYLPWRKIQSDHKEVDYWLNRCALHKIDGIFVNHAHTDHAIDLPYIATKFQSKVFGSSSVANIAYGHGIKRDLVNILEPNKTVNVGEFKITSYATPHAPHLLGIMLMDGHITTPLSSPASAWDYKVGDSYSFYIDHPEKRILFQAIGRIQDQDPMKNLTSDVLLLTIANRVSSENLIVKKVIPSGASVVIPLHHDDFFKPIPRTGELIKLFGVKTEEFEKEFLRFTKVQKLVWPKYCEQINL